jgi:hypothetical protein
MRRKLLEVGGRMNSDSTPLTVTGNAEQRVSYLEWRNISHHHTQSFFSPKPKPPPLSFKNGGGFIIC